VITHNLGVVSRYADNVNVMYAGKIVEMGSTIGIFNTPRHPYTVGLMDSVPRLDATEHVRLSTIEGQPPLLIDPIPGCAFEPRCGWAIEKCITEKPPLELKSEGHFAACWRNPSEDARTDGKEAATPAAAQA
jgi:oligopeptide/dipeptide ABC transporter ATP-binding protein